LASRIAERVWGAEHVAAASILNGSESLHEQVAEWVGLGLREIVLVPAVLPPGRNLQNVVETLVVAFRESHPAVRLSLRLPSDLNLAMEDDLTERIWGAFAMDRRQPSTGLEIERRSHTIIDSCLTRSRWAEHPARSIVRRVIHSTADVSFADHMRIHPEAVSQGVAALRAGKPVICDVRMVMQGITRYGGEKLCAVHDPAVAELARSRHTTRSAAAMEFLRDSLDGAVVAVGNAPTALWQLIADSRTEGAPRPAVVVGMPVGFVGALEAKMALVESDLVYITNISPRGGSPVAAAAVNALSLIAQEEDQA
jgi:precorrin-8X/cobalt-precorrin-8 methylmutase